MDRKKPAQRKHKYDIPDGDWSKLSEAKQVELICDTVMDFILNDRPLNTKEGHSAKFTVRVNHELVDRMRELYEVMPTDWFGSHAEYYRTLLGIGFFITYQVANDKMTNPKAKSTLQRTVKTMNIMHEIGKIERLDRMERELKELKTKVNNNPEIEWSKKESVSNILDGLQRELENIMEQYINLGRQITMKTCSKINTVSGSCTSLIKDSHICKLPSEFRCPQEFSDGSVRLSHSQLQTYLSCKRKYMLGYIDQWTCRNECVSKPMKMGQLLGVVMQDKFDDHDIDAIKKVIEEYDIGPVEIAKVRAINRAHNYLGIKIEDDGYVGCEVPFNYYSSEGDLNITGRYDVLFNDHFEEYKFSSRPENYLEIFPLQSQIGTYFLANEDLEYVTMKVCVPPALRYNGDKEDIQEYEDRIYSAVLSQPSRYFKGFKRIGVTYGKKFYRAEFDLGYLRQRYNWIGQEIRESRERGSWYHNENSCFDYSGCEFYGACTTGVVSETIFKKKEDK